MERMLLDPVEVSFAAEVWHWRGPAPFHFVSVPADLADVLGDVAPLVSYGWGMLPVTVRIGETRWETAAFPRDGTYVVPLRVAVRRAERIDVGDVVDVTVQAG